MTDARLRELERRWRETGELDDEAALLRERVRVGILRADRLELVIASEPERDVSTSTTPRSSVRSWSPAPATRRSSRCVGRTGHSVFEATWDHVFFHERRTGET